MVIVNFDLMAGPGVSGIRPPASPSCRLALRAGSHRGLQGPMPRWEVGPVVVR